MNPVLRLTLWVTRKDESGHYLFGFGLVLDYGSLWFVFRRKNWARWFVTIFTLPFVCYDPFLWHREHLTFSVFQSVWFWLSDLLDIIAVVLLFHPTSNRWFRAHKPPPNTAPPPTPTAPLSLWMV